jgi:outer membrane protein OmpA-like peptidoglycan-associated protein
LSKSYPVLQAIANVLTLQPDLKHVVVEGHTDSTGGADKNRSLSERRAQSAVRWLVAHGIAAERLEARGFGPDRPVADNATAGGRAANRRVEFHIAP